jgi:membrane protease YdiL (CAAX protease family)
MVGSLRAGLATARALVARLPWWAEFLLVVGIAFGWFGYVSVSRYLAILADPSVLASESAADADPDAGAYLLVGIELALGSLLIALLALRGWPWSDLGFRVTPRRALAGVALWFTGQSLMAIARLWEFVLFGEVPAGWDERPFPTPAGAARSLLAQLLVATVNPLFEEGFVVWYVVRRLEGQLGVLFAVVASAAIRAVYHTYQGPLNALCILVYGLLHASVYARWRQGFPIVFAHGLANLA